MNAIGGLVDGSKVVSARWPRQLGRRSASSGRSPVFRGTPEGGVIWQRYQSVLPRFALRMSGKWAPGNLAKLASRVPSPALAVPDHFPQAE
jgi:hypothetical protein